MSNKNQAHLLPALHRLQEKFGYISNHAIADLAKAHNIAQAEVVGVIGFYHDFRSTPPGRQRLRICRAESCQAMGASPRLLGWKTVIHAECRAESSSTRAPWQAQQGGMVR